MDPKGKIALVTGALSGIGLAIAKELLASGAKVALCDINATAAKEVIADINKRFDKKAIFIETDVRDQKSFAGAFQKAKTHFGGLDIVVNCAGIFNDREWEREIDINLKGVIRGSLLALDNLGKDKGGNGGVIINISSTAGLEFFPTYPIYITTKHGVIAFSKSLGMPFLYDQTGVRVLTVCPGKMETPLMRSCHKGSLRPEWEQFTYDTIASFPCAEAESVGKCCLRMIREAENGAVWVTEEDETFTINIPDRFSMATKV